MEFEINGLTIGGRTNFKIRPGVEGLDEPDQRNSSFVYSGRDGGLVTQQFYGMRPITIIGTIVSGTCEQHELDRRELAAALEIRKDLDVTIKLFTGATYKVKARRMQLDMPLVAPTFSDYKIELLCSDFLLYQNDAGAAFETTIQKVISGGYITPYVLPVEWEEGGTGKNIANNGTALIYPQIEFRDSATNPIIYNDTTGEFMQVNLSMVDGDVLIIDMRERTILLNGGSVIANKSAASTWWALDTGINKVRIDSDSGDDNVYALVRWFNGFIGI